jgi:hypothetical protein
MAVAVADTHMELVIMETQGQWVKAQAILTVEAQAVEAEQVEIISTEQVAVVEELAELDKMQLIQHFKMVVEHLETQVALDLVLEHLVEDTVQITAGHHGLVAVVVADKECTVSQVAVAVVEELAEEDHQVVAQVAHRQ